MDPRRIGSLVLSRLLESTLTTPRTFGCDKCGARKIVKTQDDASACCPRFASAHKSIALKRHPCLLDHIAATMLRVIEPSRTARRSRLAGTCCARSSSKRRIIRYENTFSHDDGRHGYRRSCAFGSGASRAARRQCGNTDLQCREWLGFRFWIVERPALHISSAESPC